MTIFGPDISSYEHGLDIAALTDQFILAKVTEGTYYRDADWPAFRDAARRAGKILVGYHFVTGEDPHAQAANLAGWIGDKNIPVMLDFEPTGNSRPTHAQQLAVADAVNAAGMRTRLSYTPRWYWQQIGSPDLTGLTARGIGVVSSNYPNTSITDPPRDYAADGGDSGPGWAPYGGITPLLWQFTDAGFEQQRMDFNAYRGSVAELAKFLGPTPTAGGTDVTPDEIAAVAVAVYEHGEEVVTVDGRTMKNVSLGNLAHGAWVSTNDPRGPVRADLAAIQATINAVATKVGAPSADALAAAIAPLKAELDAVNAKIDAMPDLINQHVAAGATLDEFAAAVMRHLSAATANG